MYVLLITYLEEIVSSLLICIQQDGKMMYTRPEEMFYHDISEEEQTKWVGMLKHSCESVYRAPVPYEPWHDFNCMYIFCTNDKALPYSAQQQMAAVLGEKVPSVSLDSSHSPFLSMPEKVMEAVEMAAQEGAVQKINRGPRL
jgi:hypothetical protein